MRVANIIFIMSFIFSIGCGALNQPLPSLPKDGVDGKNGTDGFNSLVSLIPDNPLCPNGGVTIVSALDTNRSGEVELDSDSNVKTASVCNGESVQGLFSNVQILNPCGDAPNIIDEVLLRLSDGSVLASVSDKANGNNTRLSLIGPGTYKTTDGSECVFTLTPEGTIH